MWEVSEEMKRVQREINSLFSSYTHLPEIKDSALQELKNSLLALRKPLIDLKETERELILIVELPGVERKDVSLDIKDDKVHIMVKRRAEVKAVKENYHIEERSYKGFYRLVELPHPVIPDQARASYRDGLLEIILPKGQKKERKEILIQ